MIRNAQFLNTAEAFKPILNRRTVSAQVQKNTLKDGDSLVLDFQEHLVGFVTLSLAFEGSHPEMLIGTPERDKRLDVINDCEYAVNDETFD